MSQLKIKTALEVRLQSVQPLISLAWENASFSPSVNVPYQVAFVLFGKPENPTMGDGFYRERGYLQVQLKYPQNIGTGNILARAELLRNWFKRGLSLENGNVVTIIETTPEIQSGYLEDDRFVVNVFIYFFANIFAENENFGGNIPAPSVSIITNVNEFLIEKTTGEAIGALKAVKLNEAGFAFIGDKDDLNVQNIIGISINSASLNSLITIQIGGQLIDSNWNWQEGNIWLGDNGNPTQTLPTTGSIFKLGVAVGPNSMIIQPELIAIL